MSPAAQRSHCSVAVRTRCGARSVLGRAWHRASQWERSASPLQPPRCCCWVSAERFPPSRLRRAAGGPARTLDSQPGRKASARGSSACPCAAAPRSLTPNLPHRQSLRALPYADCPPRPAASDLLCSKGAWRSLMAPSGQLSAMSFRPAARPAAHLATPAQGGSRTHVHWLCRAARFSYCPGTH